jgi:signal transduction histidine kinase
MQLIGAAFHHEVLKTDLGQLPMYTSAIEFGLKHVKREKDKEGAVAYIDENNFNTFRAGAEGLVKKGYEVHEALTSFHTMIHYGEIPAEMVKTVFLAELISKNINNLPESSRAVVKLEIPSPEIKVSLPFVFFPNVLMNLVNNAIDHGKATEVRIWFNAEERTLYVRDNGKGISEEALLSIFDFGYRGASSKGSGVGLAFVKMVVEAAGGTIECYSSQEGVSYTEFKIYLPY